MKRNLLSHIFIFVLTGVLVVQPITVLAETVDFVSDEEMSGNEFDSDMLGGQFINEAEAVGIESSDDEMSFTDSIIVDEEEPVENSNNTSLENEPDVFVDEESNQYVDEPEEVIEPEVFTDGLDDMLEVEEGDEAASVGVTLSSATNVSFGTSYNGSISSSAKSKLYRFTTSYSGRVVLSSTAAISGVYYSLYDSTGKQLWYDYYSANSSGQSSISEYFDLTKGTYYLGVESNYNTGNFSFKLTFSSAGESFTESGTGNNNTIAAANSISLGKNYKGQLAINDNKDFYKFSVGTSGRCNLSSTAAISGVYYSLYDSTGKQLWYDYYNANSSGQSSISEYFDLTKGTYYLGAESNYNTGNYSFKLTFSSAGESFTESGTGNNNTIAAANSISLGKNYKGQLAINDNKDFYKFSVGTSGRYTLSSTAAISGVYYRLYDSTGKQLWYDYYSINSSGQSRISEHFDLTKGTYYLGVESSYNTGNYSYTISMHTHSFKSTATKATTYRNGILKKECSCGYKTQSTIYRPSKLYLSTSKYTYDGKVKTPSVTVKDSNGRTIGSSNYSLYYAKNRKNVGRYTVKVSFKGNYSGSLQTSFVINPKSTYIRKMAGGSRSFRVYWRIQNVQTSGYQIQFALNNRFTSGKKTYTISGNRKTSATYKNLQRNKRYYVRVRTYRVVSGVRYYSTWSSTKTVNTKR